ncbi:MAG: tripartite tricarboxylate transporter substrate-binding protein [Gammaproteobacteria bacterium]|nr:tripartite tricarboxylate transporter substrate-binding protein [Gammaproteobacteria bacterium]
MNKTTRTSRREFLKVSGAALAAGGVSTLPLRFASAQNFPSRNINVYVPTREGGGADRNLRAFSNVWKKYLNTNFEPGFYPSASGRVGYELYMGKAKADGYNLIFGNMGPELLNWVVKKPTFEVSDCVYFGRVDTDPGCVFVGANSPFKHIDEIVEAGKKRKLNVGTSRLAHPASIGILALGEHTGAQFNLIPLSGGKNTVAGAVTGEMDFSVLTSGTVAARGNAVRTLLVFNDVNVLGERLDNAPTINDHFGTKLPPLLSSRAFAIHRAAIEAYPDRFKVLQESFKQVFADPEYKEAVVKAKGNWEYINYGGITECEEYAKNIQALGERFRPLLTGKA